MPEKKLTTTIVAEEIEMLPTKEGEFKFSCSIDNREYLVQFEYSFQDNEFLEKAYNTLFEEVFKSDWEKTLQEGNM